MLRNSTPETEAARQTTGIIFDVKRYAIHDGPGIRTTVFLKGCPLRCRWCHNPESLRQEPEHSFRAGRCIACARCVEACPQGAISECDGRLVTEATRCVFCGSCVEACPSGAREIVGRTVTVAEILPEIERDRIFHEESGGGVTISGGEPLMQPEFLKVLLRECKARDVHTALDTTCFSPWKAIQEIIDHVDLFLVDVKHMDPAAHQQFTGVSNERILENIRRLARCDKQIIIAVPVVPGVNDDRENLAATGEFARSLGGVVRIDLLPYNGAVRGKLVRLAGEYETFEGEPPSEQRMRAIAGELEPFGIDVTIGG